MANMAYVRFENTHKDLLDCQYAMWEVDKLSEREREYRLKLIKLCKEIVEEFGVEVPDDDDDDQEGFNLMEWGVTT